MSTIGIVAISILAALFLFLLLGVTIFNAWLGWNTRRLLNTSQRENETVHTETQKILATNWADTKTALVTHQKESQSQIESAKASFGAIRGEVRSLLEDHRRELASVLETHRNQMQLGIDKINAEALQAAAARSIQACLRLEKAVTVIQQAFLDTEERVTNQYGPEEFAPEEGRFGAPPSGYSVSQTASLDEQVLIEEAAAQSGSAG